MAPALYADAGGFMTAEGTMTLAFGQAYGGSTVVYTGTSLPPPERVIRAWNVPGLEHADLVARAGRYAGENGVLESAAFINGSKAICTSWGGTLLLKNRSPPWTTAFTSLL